MTAYKQKEDEIIVRKNTLDLKGVLVPDSVRVMSAVLCNSLPFSLQEIYKLYMDGTFYLTRKTPLFR